MNTDVLIIILSIAIPFLCTVIFGGVFALIASLTRKRTKAQSAPKWTTGQQHSNNSN